MATHGVTDFGKDGNVSRRLHIEQVLTHGSELIAAPLEVDGVALFDGWHLPIAEVWEDIAHELRRRDNEAKQAEKEYWRAKAAEIYADKGPNRLLNTLNGFMFSNDEKVRVRSKRQLQAIADADEPFLPLNSPMPISFPLGRLDRCAACGGSMITTVYRNETKVCSTICEQALEVKRADHYRERKKQAMRQRRGYGLDLTRNCEQCGEAFTPKRRDAKCCSVRCRQRKAAAT